jgi:Tfp pilus assembly protein PilO
MLANRTSRWSIGTVLLCIILLSASWFLLISPRRADAADVQSKVVSTTEQAAELEIQIAQLKADFADLPKRKAELKAIKQQLPPKANIPAFVRDLRSISGQAGVSLDSVAPAGPALLAGAAGSATATDGAVVKIPIAIGITGDYFEAALFLKNLQTKLQRSYLITGLAAVPAPEEATTATTAPVATATSTAVATAVATEAPAATAAAVPSLDRVTLSITGSVFVLMDGTTTLEQVTKDAKAATGTATATPAATSTAPAAASTATTN